jgi:hypothetical protein
VQPRHRRFVGEEVAVLGYRIEHSEKEPKIDEKNVPGVLSGNDILIRLFGTGFTEQTWIIFTTEINLYKGPCQMPVSKKFKVGLLVMRSV